ncbi:MAG: acyl-CoA mutase large subunit family protein, partial [Deltaproteobacteria bacterium]|nr:acyl-CoA mutase large subunit family protein [Deltaproteobacteria bacterium]
MAEIDEKDLWEPAELFGEFEAATYDQWRRAAEESLKGAPFEKRLVTKTYEGINLAPMYWPKDVEGLELAKSLPGTFPFARGTAQAGHLESPWVIAQQTVEPTPDRANEVLAHDMARGQTGIHLVLDRPTRLFTDADHATGQVGVDGLSLCTAADAKTLFAGLDPAAPLHVDAGALALPLLCLLAAGREQAGLNAPPAGVVGADPLAELAATGSLTLDFTPAFDAMAAAVLLARESFPGLRTILVSAQPYHNAGAGAEKELAFAMATAAEYARAMGQRGLTADDVFASMALSFSVGRNMLMEIAKLRAARVLFAMVAEAFGASEQAAKAHVHARTSWWTKTAYDPYTNMIRNTTEAFAAVMGGVDSLHVGFFDELVRHPGEFSRRVSRNLQVLLQAEARFIRPVDPAGGSWCVESLTWELGEKAWSLFQEIEGDGGMTQALYAEGPQQACADTAAQKRVDVERRKEVFVGVNKYPNLEEKPLEDVWPDYETVASRRMEEVARARHGAGAPAVESAVADVVSARMGGDLSAMGGKCLEAARAGATLGALGGALAAGGDSLPSVRELDFSRGAEVFEDLRKNAERMEQETGKRPRVFL